MSRGIFNIYDFGSQYCSRSGLYLLKEDAYYYTHPWLIEATLSIYYKQNSLKMPARSIKKANALIH